MNSISSAILVAISVGWLAPLCKCIEPLSASSAAATATATASTTTTADYRTQGVRMLADLIRHERTPTNVFLAACWTPAQKAATQLGLPCPVTMLPVNGDFQLAGDVNRNLVQFVVDLDCEWRNGWLAAINSTYLEHPIRWLLLSRQDLTGDAQELWQDVPIWVDSHMTVATWNASAESFWLEQYYKIHADSANATAERFGVWSQRTEPRFRDERETRILSRRRRNLQRTPLQASIVILNNASLEHLTDYKDNTVDTISKTNYVLVDALMDTLNVTHRYKFVDTWGYFHPVTKQINGMLGDLKDGVSVIAGTSLFPTEERVPHFDYSSMITPTKTRFIFRAPPLSYVANIYYLPFHGMVWLCAGALVFISCLAIYCSFRGAAIVDPSAAVDGTETKVRGTDIVLLGVGAIAQMGSTLEARFLSARISTIFFFIFLLFMYTSYTANIVSLLQATTKSIRTLDDLYRSKLDYGVDDTPYNRWYFPNTVGEIRRKIYEQKIAPPKQQPKYVNSTYGVSRMRQGLYTFHTELGPAYRMIEQTFFEHEKCGIVVMDYLGVPEPWVVVRKRTPYKEMIRINFFKIREHGIQDREVSKMYSKKPICVAGGQSFQSVRLVDCYIVLQVLGTGCGLAAVLFVLEVLFHRRAKRLGTCCLY